MSVVTERCEALITKYSPLGEHALVAALMRIARLPDAVGYRAADALGAVRRHRQRLHAWLADLAAQGEDGHADHVVADLAACRLVLEDEPVAAVTFDQLIDEAVRGEGTAEEIAGELLRGCPSRERHHWDRLLQRVEAAKARLRSGST